jgi:succinate dehydrogenase/fumarate reductase flavoprotein subunit
MTCNRSEKKDFTRRDFIRTTAAGVGATALAGLGVRTASAANLPEKWDEEADVVVVGCGGAGTIAAITAHDAGARVIVLEKAPEGGGNTRVGGGQFCYTIPATKDDAAVYMHAACNGTTPMAVCRAWADELVHYCEWLDEMEVAYTSSGDHTSGGDFGGFPGAGSIGHGVMNGYGVAWYAAIEKQLEKRGIDIWFESPALSLVRDGADGDIAGVRVSRKGKETFVKAARGVVLCSGGFEFNEDMKQNYLRPGAIKFTGWIYNTGDGIRMAQSVGADLWHMNMIASALYTIVTPESEMGWMYPEPKGSNFILVSKYGERFMKEGQYYAHRSIMGYACWDWRNDRKDPEYPCCPHYMIFDETTRLAGPIGINETSVFKGMGNTITPTWLGGAAPAWGELAGWSRDNSREIEKGWILKADSIGALAEKIGGEVTPETLAATVRRWNGFCDAGVDEDFGRTNDAGARAFFPRNLEKIETPPFYAVELWPGGFSTMGGPKKNEKGQVLNVDGEPVGRLYAAGSMGHTLGQLYSISGANYGEIFAWGRISGRNAAGETPC